MYPVSKYVDIIKKYIFSKISTSVFAEDLQNVKNNIDRYFENAQ
ncbi:hypothetical protein BACCOPRO_00083 [Phocaeicola coprophilus DSM 18228 = JCM 13818]|uniref:Uncharacterized protein n=1 Tax=Phocaeicola coprophilus DSM 18228 = JCM 13818 TaxID=547042 RepID=S0F444_9BACT|nr:hypothetical protein BACCOPRO_00083 [Phocaeicola coprophilus DSM 18228 = JCM 13818]